MGHKGDCWDNASAESLFGSLKTGSVNRHDFGDHRAAVDKVMEGITRYNCARMHSTLGYLSPMSYEKKWIAQHAAHAT